jgi:predicted Fe-Mo cluster-binding NifX family protein
MNKILIPIEHFKGKSSLIFQHFGRAPMFALINLSQDHEIKDIRPVQKASDNFGGHGAAEAIALQFNVDAVIVKGMGPRGLQAFQEKGVTVFTGAVNTVGEALDAYLKKDLSELTEPCKDALHK